jgi:PPP family 3-phenylpropionic acid transporter
MPLVVRLSIFYASLCFFSGVQLPFLPVWLHARGLSSQEISAVIATAMFLRIAAGPIFASLADHWGNRRGMIILLAWGAMIAVSLLPLMWGFWPILFVCLAMLSFWPAMTPIAETIVMRAQQEQGIVYGQVRLWCSVTFIFASTGMGWLLEWNPPSIIAFVLIGTLALNLAGAYLLAKDVPVEGLKKLGGQGFRGIGIILRNPMFMVGLLTGAMLQSSHSMFYAFGTLNWQRLGYSENVIGLLWGLAVVAEIILFAYSGRVMAWIGPGRMMMIAGLGAAVRWGAMAFDPPLWLLFPLQLLHALSFCAAHLGAVHFVAAAAPHSLAATAQSLYASLSAGVMMGVMTLVAGQLYPHFGSQTYLLPAVLGLLGFAGALVVMAWWKGGPLFDENKKRTPPIVRGGC